jgi:hypothetical protein
MLGRNALRAITVLKVPRVHIRIIVLLATIAQEEVGLSCFVLLVYISLISPKLSA